MIIPLLFLLLFSSPQTESQKRPGDLRYRVDVSAVLYEVRVADETGKPLTGLDSSCFNVIVGGVSRPVVFFDEVASRPLNLAILLDIGSGMSVDNVRKGKAFIFDLIHPLDHSEQIIIGIFGDPEEQGPDTEKRKLSGLYGNFDETEFLSELTSDRLKLLRALENLTIGAPPSRAKLTSPSTVPPGSRGPAATIGFTVSGSNSGAGLAIDEALAGLKGALPGNRAILVISAGLPNVGEGTLEHLTRDDASLFESGFDYKLGNLLDLGFNKRHRVKIVRMTAGASIPADLALAQISDVRRVLKHSYLIAYRPSEPAAGANKQGREAEVEFRVRPITGNVPRAVSGVRLSSRKMASSG